MQTVTHQTKHLKVLPKHERVFLSEWTSHDISELQLGMIKSAIDDVRDGRKSKKMQLEARQWLLSNDDISPLSFHNCCAELELDADKLLRLLNTLLNGELFL